MPFRRIISALVIIAIVQALVVPVVAESHPCAGTEGVKWALHLQSADRITQDSHDHADHHDADHHHDETESSVRKLLRSPGASYCCTHGTTAPSRGELDVATMPNTVWSNAAIVVLTMAGNVLEQTNSESLARTAYKIESSPPYRATIQRHTYLRTSILLI
jgi:hypothetical protein